MIKADLDKNLLVTGTGRKIRFDKNLYLNVVKFLMKKFNVTYEQAYSQLNYFLATNNRVNGDRKSTNARLNNIINLDYEWAELWN
jgi:hypothetical protein